MKKITLIMGIALLTLLIAGCTGHTATKSNATAQPAQSKNNTFIPVNYSTSTMVITNCNATPLSVLIRKNFIVTIINNDSVSHNFTFFTTDSSNNYTASLGPGEQLKLNYSAHPPLVMDKREYSVLYYCDKNDASYNYILAVDSTFQVP